MAKRGVDDYLASAQDSYHLADEHAKKLTDEDSNRMRGLKKSTSNRFISSAKDFANAAKISESKGYNEGASDYFLMASESANKALEINSKDSIKDLISIYESKSKNLEKQIGGEGNLEQTILSITLVTSFIFGIDLLSHKFTGNVIGSGNTPVDLSVGLLLLMASLIGIFFLLKNKNPKPIPHPERKKK